MGIFHWILVIKGYQIYHHAILAVYFASYFALFGAALAFISKRAGEAAALFASPFLWVLQEWLRGNMFFLGLPWGLLGHSQYRTLNVIQIAALTGTYSISFLIILVNSALVVLLRRVPIRFSGFTIFWTKVRWTKPEIVLLVSTALCVGSVLGYGYVGVSQRIDGKSIDVALIQGNIEQEKKWDPKYIDEIMNTYSHLTVTAAQYRPLMIIWPETATPGSISINPDIYDKLVNLVKKIDTPLIFGSAQHRKFAMEDQGSQRFLNSAFLLTPSQDTRTPQHYDKILLFPFGEYLPYKEVIPWRFLNVSSFNEYIRGNEYTVFHISPHRFGVTICWENIFPGLVRQFVKNGAEFIINITNEARFGKTAAPYQLSAISVFRAVENRTYVIRCANTGISCIIDPFGRIAFSLRDLKGNDIFTRGILLGKIIPGNRKSAYTRFGDTFPVLSSFVSIAFLIIAWIKPKQTG
jgi:apolipoprotein N-acyltransferase